MIIGQDQDDSLEITIDIRFFSIFFVVVPNYAVIWNVQ